MKQLICLISFLLVSQFALAQKADTSLFGDFKRVNKNTSLVLTTWAGANIAVNGALWFNAQGSQKYFYEMNTIWNVVNLAIALPAVFAKYKSIEDAPDRDVRILKQTQRTSKIVLFNMGFDLAYVTAGLWFKDRARFETGVAKDRFEGYGNAILLQGAFLFCYDIFYYSRLNRFEKRRVLPQLNYSLNPYNQKRELQFGMRYSF